MILTSWNIQVVTTEKDHGKTTREQNLGFPSSATVQRDLLLNDDGPWVLHWDVPKMMSLEQYTYFHLFQHGNFTGICIHIYTLIYINVPGCLWGMYCVSSCYFPLLPKIWGDTQPPPMKFGLIYSSPMFLQVHFLGVISLLSGYKL